MDKFILWFSFLATLSRFFFFAAKKKLSKNEKKFSIFKLENLSPCELAWLHYDEAFFLSSPHSFNMWLCQKKKWKNFIFKKHIHCISSFIQHLLLLSKKLFVLFDGTFFIYFFSFSGMRWRVKNSSNSKMHTRNRGDIKLLRFTMRSLPKNDERERKMPFFIK